jgi:hypothetical protein
MVDNAFSNLKLTAVEREQVANLAGDVIAVQVYRELQKANDAAVKAASGDGSPIIGNCCSSSKSDMLARV